VDAIVCLTLLLLALGYLAGPRLLWGKARLTEEELERRYDVYESGIYNPFDPDKKQP